LPSFYCVEGGHEHETNLWDLETVPDLGGFAAANDLVGKSDGEPLKPQNLPASVWRRPVCADQDTCVSGWQVAHLLQIPRRRGATLSTKFTTN